MLGYRERRTHKSQQKQEAFGKAYSAEQRVKLPAPEGYNYRDEAQYLQANEAQYIDNARKSEYGLTFSRYPRLVSPGPSSAANGVGSLISYDASGSSSAEMWAIFSASSGLKVYNIGEVINGGTTATASGAAITSMGGPRGDYTVFNNTVIYVNSIGGSKWTRASGWTAWSATVSAGDIDSADGITSFKNRLIAWNSRKPEFTYGSTDQIEGTFNTFDLAGIINSNLVIAESYTKDGGAGPDDYLVLIGENGKTAVYAGTDPADANAWSIVGVYQIGKPVSRASVTSYGQQIVVLCEDDFYFIPQDLDGKKQASKGVHKAIPDTIGLGLQTNAVNWKEKNLLCYGDGTIINAKHNYAFSTFRVNSSTEGHTSQSGSPSFGRVYLATYKGKLYGLGAKGNVYEFMPETGSLHTGKIISRPIPVSGRSVISLVNPVFDIQNDNCSASSEHNIRYRTAIVYDKELDWKTTASANAWVTVSTSADSQGLWTPGFGNGHMAQIHVEVISASTSGELVLKRIDFTVSDTGGI